MKKTLALVAILATFLFSCKKEKEEVSPTEKSVTVTDPTLHSIVINNVLKPTYGSSMYSSTQATSKVNTVNGMYINLNFPTTSPSSGNYTATEYANSESEKGEIGIAFFGKKPGSDDAQYYEVFESCSKPIVVTNLGDSIMVEFTDVVVTGNFTISGIVKIKTEPVQPELTGSFSIAGNNFTKVSESSENNFLFQGTSWINLNSLRVRFAEELVNSKSYKIVGAASSNADEVYVEYFDYSLFKNYATSDTDKYLTVTKNSDGSFSLNIPTLNMYELYASGTPATRSISGSGSISWVVPSSL